MKFQTDRKELENALKIVGNAISTNAIEGDKGYITILADAEKCVAKCSNGELTIKTVLSRMVQLDERGNVGFRVDGKRLISTVGKLPNGIVVLELKGASLVLHYENGQIKLPTTEWDYENDVANKVQSTITLSGTDFKVMAEQVTPFVAIELARAVLRGINFQTHGDKFVAVGCDGYRLAKVVLSAKSSATTE